MKVVFDVVQRRPGCAILQAVMGGDQHVATLFSSETWLISPTDDMRCMEVNEDQMAQLIVMAEKAVEA